MISDSAYIEILKNCSKWNSRTLGGKKKYDIAVFDQQTGVVQKPTEHLYRNYVERYRPLNKMQVCAYPSKKWTRSKEVSSHACKMKYYLNISPALNDAILSLSNPNSNLANTSENYFDQNTSMRSMYMKFDANEMDISEYDIEEPDNDPSDEDDWGNSGKKRRSKKVNQNLTNKWRNNLSMNALGNGNGINQMPGTPVAEVRPFVCQLCGAKYKSRPGLTYHRIHVHRENNNQTQSQQPPQSQQLQPQQQPQQQQQQSLQQQQQFTPKSPIVSNALKPSTVCDFCSGTRLSNKKGKLENLMSCNDCGRSGHPSCLKFTANMLLSVKRHGWQCIECKTCAICGTSENDHQLLFCDDCDRGFHLYCLNPPLKVPPENDWSCENCMTEFGQNSSIMSGRKALSD